MFANNPYAQGGWYNPQNPHSINHSPWHPNSSQPPTFGALPNLNEKPTSVLTFEFSSFNPDILNCLVTGPKGRKFFDIRTSNSTTVISKPGEVFATIQWTRHPVVEAPGVVSRQATGEFLKLSQDQAFRMMTVSGRSYKWIPRSNGVYLYSAGPNPPTQFARVSLSSDNARVLLEITSEAFQAGLFEPCIICTVLLFSARNID